MVKRKLFQYFKKISILLNGTGISGIPGTLKLYLLFRKVLSQGSVEIDNDILFLDKDDSLSLGVFGFYGKIQTEFTKTLVKRGWTVVDVGAHIGYFTTLFARLVGTKGRVFSFEPNMDNYRLLRKSVMRNHYVNVVLENKAVSDIDGEVNLLHSDSSVEHRLVKKSGVKKVSKVDSVTLDGYFRSYKKEINLVKIDVEGTEYQVLEGMVRLIEKNKNLSIILEYCPEHLLRYGVDPKDVLNFLSRYDFKIYEIDEVYKAVVSASIKTIIKKYRRHGLTNLFFIRNKIL